MCALKLIATRWEDDRVRLGGPEQEVKSGAAVSVMATADDLRGLQDRLIRLEREETTDWKAGFWTITEAELHWILF